MGVDAQAVEVEVELSMGLPVFSVIGLGDTAIQEARFRIQAALRNAGLELPHKRITINLAPAALRKDGASLDLPMALSLLAAAGQLEPDALADTICVGELALSGQLRPVRGALCIAALAKSMGLKRIIVPRPNGPEAMAIEGIEVLAPENLGALTEHLSGQTPLQADPRPTRKERFETVDFRDVKGQSIARRALEIAATGEHNLLLVGNPGSGKTMLAQRAATILPPLSPEEQIEVTKVWSAASLTLGHGGLIEDRPFRAPHHSVSASGLVGGGSTIRPGEISLAHRGILFLDEMPELPRRILESLRQPMEDREVVIARARQSARLPACFMLIGAANPCPCGWFGHPSDRCWCTQEEVTKYVSRISGPLLDRIDMVVEAPSLTAKELMSEEEGESSKTVRDRVTQARTIALGRANRPNGRLSGRLLWKHARPNRAGRKLLTAAIDNFQLSGRGMERTLRIARSIADLKNETKVTENTILEALQYRQPNTWSQGTPKARLPT